jgi:hypothetical protein
MMQSTPGSIVKMHRQIPSRNRDASSATTTACLIETGPEKPTRMSYKNTALSAARRD